MNENLAAVATLKCDIRCIGGDFYKGEIVLLTELPFGNFEITSLDNKRKGYAGSLEISLPTGESRATLRNER